MNVSTRRLWFHIEAAFADIHRLCADARATELKAKEAAAQAEDPDMPMWREPRFEVSGDIEATVSIAAPVPERRGDGHQGADVVALRAELRKRLVQLRLKLAENLTEREAYYALFPVVIYVDELVQSVFEGKARLYRPLQQELFEIDNGGEAFYSVADTLLRKAETLPLIFEVFYFCLSDGFRGMYVQEPARIEEYQARLAQRIPVERPAATANTDLEEVPLVTFPKRYYLAAAGAVLAVFVGLFVLARYQIGERGGAEVVDVRDR